MSARTTFNCPLCTHFQAPEFKLLLPHIRLVHSTRPGFSIQCGIDNCARRFINMKTYTNHIYICDSYKTLQQLQPVLHNKKLNVGAVKEQVGVAFTYPNIHLSAWFLESSGHCCSDNRGSTVHS